MKQFTSLHNHDRYSMLDGLRPPEEFLTKAKEIGMTAYAQTNHGSMSGFFDFYDAAKKVGIKPIFGVEAYFVNNKLKKGEKIEVNGKEKTVYEKPRHIILLAKNIKGYKKLLKSQYHACKEGMYYKPRIDWSNLKELAGDIVVSSACSAGVIAAPIVNKNIQEAKEVAMKLKDIFKDDFYIEYIALERTKEYGPIWTVLRDIAKELKIRSIITLDVHYPNKEDAFYQDLLHCISTKYTIDDIKSKTAWIYEDRDLYLKNYDEAKMIMSRVFNERHVEKFLDNTNEIASKIEEFNIYPEEFVLPKVGFEEAKLKQKLKQGFKERTDPNKKDIYLNRLNYEYKIVKKLGFLEYFWIVQNVVNWSKNKNIEVGAGRGCFLPNSKVKINKGNKYKSIEDIEVGDKVLVYDRTFQKVLNKFEYRVVEEDCCEIKFSNNKVIRCTNDHKIMTKKGWVEAKYLRKNQFVIGPVKSMKKLTNVRCSDCKVERKVLLKDLLKQHSVKKSGEYICCKCFNKRYSKTLQGLKQRKLGGLAKKKAAIEFVNNNKKFNKYEIWSEKELGIKNDLIHDSYKILSINKFKYNGKVYDIEVENAKNYTISDISVHNSAAGSLISYLLGITDIDPIKFDLSFERFLNPTRKKMPDIDIDFSQARRNEVFEYMKTYGEDKVAHIANLVGFTEKLAFQDIGKIYKISYDEVCRVTKNMEEFGVPDKYKKEHEVAKKIMGNYRHYSQHAGGIVVTDKPIYEYLPTVNLKQEVQTGINGDTLQKKGFLKIDVLALTDLDILRYSINYVKKYEGKDIDILNINIEDSNVLKLFENGDTDSIFQFNTYPFKCLLKEAQPRKFKHLAELNAVNRPNAKKLRYDTEYVKRRFMKDERIPAAPKIIGDHLKDTFNLLLYQEQLMNILADWLDIDHGYADNLRRDIEGDSFMPVMSKYKQQLFKKYGEQDTMEAMRYLQEAAGYSFNKSHSVSYAYIAYQMAYMKVYYRKYFNLAVFNIEKDLPKIESTITDCKKNNIPIKPWNINDFSFDFYVNNEGQIVPGVKILKGIGEKSALPIYQNKPYRDADDFLKRSKARKNIVEALYKFKFFERAFGKVENNKIKEYLDNKEAAKKRAKFKINKKKVEKDIL